MKEQEWWHYLHDFLIEKGVSENYASWVNTIILFILMLILVYLLDFILWKIIRSISSRFAKKTKTNFDNIAVTNKLPRHLAHILPLLLAFDLTPLVFYDIQYVENIAVKILMIIAVLLTLSIAQSLLRTVSDFLKTLPRFKDKPINSYIQVFMIFAWAAGFFGILAIITETDVWKFLTGLGAASAVLLLIF